MSRLRALHHTARRGRVRHPGGCRERAAVAGPDGIGTDRFVTIVARQCPTYTDITANRARNNLQESLRNLGTNTPYTDGEVVDLATEEAVQPKCTPITGWQFTLGTSIAGERVSGDWGSLSVVAGTYPTDVTTLASVPERDDAGRPYTSRTVAGATTIELTPAQAGETGAALWIQGGTTTPIPYSRACPSSRTSSASARCAAPRTTSTGTTWSSSPSRPGAGTSTASPTT